MAQVGSTSYRAHLKIVIKRKLTSGDPRPCYSGCIFGILGLFRHTIGGGLLADGMSLGGMLVALFMVMIYRDPGAG